MRLIAVPLLVASTGLGHVVADAGPAPANGFSDGWLKPNPPSLQEHAEGREKYYLASASVHRDRGPSLAVIVPIPEGGLTRIQITTKSQAAHKFAAFPVIERFAPVPGGPRAGRNRFTILPIPYLVY
ncbi:hypothetical protein EDB85DRAFT_2155799 [Lactarius pseudohatsudake]|nr:hypothetical protein EDB85DRAFT_2155799 [Lactarius pseudohatsudake]